MTKTFKENIKNFMLENINSLVEQFKNQICEDPDCLYNDLVYLIYKDLDIENLKIDKFEYTFDNNEMQIISLIEILTNDIGDEYDKLVDEQIYNYIDQYLKDKLYTKAIKKVLEIEINSI